MKLKVPILTETPGLCGPYSLKMVLDFYGTVYSPEWLQEKSGATTKDGVTEHGMIRAARAAGHKAYFKKGVSLTLIDQCLRQGIPPIVGWWSCDTPHYSVVVGLTKSTLTINDPDGGKVRKIPLWAWKNLWFAEKGNRHEVVVIFPIQ